MESFNNLRDKLIEKKLDKDFWIVCGRTDFKPLVDMKKKDIQKFIKDKIQYYKNKNIAKVSLIFHQKINIDDVDESEWVFLIQIRIFNIDDDGDIDYGIGSTWSLNIEYSKNEFINNSFTLKELNQMINMAGERKIITDVTGINYNKWQKKLKKILSD